MERDEHIYVYVMEELENGIKDEALWVKATVIAEGENEKIKPKYIQYRVAVIKDILNQDSIDYSTVSKADIKNIIEGNIEDWMTNLWRWADNNSVLNYGKYTITGYDAMFWGGPSTSMQGLPRSKNKLVSIEELDMSISCELLDEDLNLYSQYNLFSYLPKEIENLVNLTKLEVYSCSLLELSKEIKNLINLETLDIRRNKISILPKEIGNLRKLKELYLSQNEIGTLPKEIGNLINLTTLDLYRCELTELPEEIGNLTNLQNLNLRWNNNLMELPHEIINLRNLDRLDIYGVSITVSKEQKEWIDSIPQVIVGSDTKIIIQ